VKLRALAAILAIGGTACEALKNLPPIVITLPSPAPSPGPSPSPSPAPSPSSSPGPEPSTSPSPVTSPTAAPTAPPSSPSPAPCVTQEVIDFTRPDGCRACSEWKAWNTTHGHPPYWVVQFHGGKKFYVVLPNRDEFGQETSKAKWYDESCDEYAVGTHRKVGRFEGACDVRVETTCQPSPSPSPTAPPTPGPSPSPEQAACDVARAPIFHWGGDCKQKGKPFELDMGCEEALITVTPKRAVDSDGDGKLDDATAHGRDLTWWLMIDGRAVPWPDSGYKECFDAGPVRACGSHNASGDDAEPTFNRSLRPLRPGDFGISTRLRCGGHDFWGDAKNGKVR
jgi:hypothetical protein